MPPAAEQAVAQSAAQGEGAGPAAASIRTNAWAGPLGDWLPACLLFVALMIVYYPALHGNFLWDDDTHISANDTLRVPDGLWQIWFKPGATCQYYPLTFSVFWIEYHLWGLNTLGYHVVNVLLHGTVAILLWQVLQRLKVRGALLAAGIFALHPVCVMSVAWMTELKNVLSATLALCAAWAYLRAARLGIYGEKELPEGAGDGPAALNWRFYALSLVLFQLALFAKTAVSFLPVTLLLITWWQGRRLDWRAVWPAVPMLALSVGMGLGTIYIERHSGGASGAPFHLPLAARVLVSGRSFWFYLAKLFFPVRLAFAYEHWIPDTAAWWQYAFPAATAGGLLALLVLSARLGRGLFAALMHFYVSTSVLVLVVVLYMMRYTYVSDHWQYFGCMSVIALVASGLSRVLGRIGAGVWLRAAACGALLLVLAVLSYRQCRLYVNAEALWRGTLRNNPNCSIAESNLGNLLLQSGHLDEAIAEFRRAVAIQQDNFEARTDLAVALAQKGQFTEAITENRKIVDALPDDSVAHYNLGATLDQAHKWDEAITEFQRAAALEPNQGPPHTAWGNVLMEQGKVDEAVAQFQRALELRPEDAIGHYNLGNIFSRTGKTNEAIAEFRRAVQIEPANAMAHNNLGNIYFQQHRLDDAIAEFQSTVNALPNEPRVRCELAYVLWQRGRTDEAIAQYRKALDSQPDLSAAQDGLRDIAWKFATSSDASARDGKRATGLIQQLIRQNGGTNSLNLSVLAAAEAESGQYTQALADAQSGLKVMVARGKVEVFSRLRREVELFQAGQPFREEAEAGGGNSTDQH